MPLYDYECSQCGEFSAFNRMSEAFEPKDCPECGESSRRIISAPHLACMPAENRKAWERNERSAHEPRVKRRGCGCSGAHTCGTGAGKDKAAATTPALQRSTKTTSRPWMLGH